MRTATRKKGATGFSCQQLLEFLFYPGKITKNDIIGILRAREDIPYGHIIDRLLSADVNELRTAIKDDIVNYIADHGVKVFTYFPLSIEGTHFTPQLAEVFVRKMVQFAGNLKNIPSSFTISPGAYFAITSEEGISPQELDAMDIRKLFTFEHAPTLAGPIMSSLRESIGHHPDWRKPRVIAETMVGMLIQQAGMMPADLEGRDVEYYDIENPDFIYARHHWWFYKASILLKDLILLGKFHNKYTYLEPYKPARYRAAMGSMKAGFEIGQCPDGWSSQEQVEYYSRLYDIIAEWNKLDPDFEQEKFEWFKVKIGGNIYTLTELMNPEVGLIEEGFIDNIIDNLIANIQRYSTFEFDAEYSDANKAEFIEEFMKIR